MKVAPLPPPSSLFSICPLKKGEVHLQGIKRYWDILTGNTQATEEENKDIQDLMKDFDQMDTYLASLEGKPDDYKSFVEGFNEVSGMNVPMMRYDRFKSVLALGRAAGLI